MELLFALFFGNCLVLQPVVKVKVISTIASPNRFSLNLLKYPVFGMHKVYTTLQCENVSTCFIFYYISEALYSSMEVPLESLW